VQLILRLREAGIDKIADAARRVRAPQIFA
jgi:hypothetical protein